MPAIRYRSRSPFSIRPRSAILAVEVGPAVVAAAVLGAETLVRGPRLDQRSVHRKMLVRQQRLDLRMVQKFGHELGKHRASLQPIALLRESSRIPDRVVGRKSHEPAVQEIVVQLIQNFINYWGGPRGTASDSAQGAPTSWGCGGT